MNRNQDPEKGVILLYTLLVLVVLTLIGAIGLQTTCFELKLSGNDRLINRLKIKAESTAATAVELVEKQPRDMLRDSNWDSPTRNPWFSRGQTDRFDMESIKDTKKNENLKDYIADLSNWTEGGEDPPNCAVLKAETGDETEEAFSKEFPECRFQVIDAEVAQGSSLQTGNRYTTLHNLYVTGVSVESKGKCMVQIGYRKRY